MECKAELKELISEMTDFILDLAPQARVEHESIVYSGEHANLTVYPPLSWPQERILDLQEQIGEHVSAVHVESGFLILVYVCTPEQQVAEAQLEFVRAKHRVLAVEQVLVEARSLGLIEADAQPTFVPVG